MLTLPPGLRIYLATARVDGRKGIDGLANMVRSHFGRDPLQGDLFAFFSRRADRVRILYWDRDGYVLTMKRLEKGTFRAPSSDAAGTHLAIEAAELLLILEGIDLRDAKRRSRWVPQTRTPQSTSG